MKRILVLFAALALLAGCSSEKPAASASSEAANATNATAAATPNSVEITNQKTVWQCPNCGMNFDGPGRCSMNDGDLVEMKVDYICPADNKPVEAAGKCPRCDQNARVVTTAVAAAVPPVVSGK